MDYVPIVKGVIIAIFLIVTMEDFSLSNPLCWIAMISLNVLVNI